MTKNRQNSLMIYRTRSPKGGNMDRNTIFKKVKEILIIEYGINENNVKMEANLANDFDLEPSDLSNFKVDLENKFDASIPEKDIANFITMKKVVDYLDTNIN
jgi:acyl carrier protein